MPTITIYNNTALVVIGSAIIKIIESNKEQNKFKISKKIEDFLIKFSREKQ